MARKIERRKAAEVLQANHLKVGDVVHSSDWVLPRVIRRVDLAGEVVLAELRANGNMKQEIFMATLPVDVHPYEHPARSRES